MLTTKKTQSNSINEKNTPVDQSIDLTGLESKRNHPFLSIDPVLVDLWTKDYDQGSFGLKLHVSTPSMVDDRGFEVSELDYKLAEIDIQSDDEISINSYLLANALWSLLDDQSIQEKLKAKFFELLKEKIEEES